MRKSLFLLSLVIVFFSCKKNEEELKINTETEKVVIVEKKDIDEKAILPEAKEYYENIATMANWYADHKKFVEINKLKNNTGNVLPRDENTLLNKLEEMVIVDKYEKEVSFFDLDRGQQKAFLDNFIDIEAYALTKKINMLPNKQYFSMIKETNLAFKQTFENLKAVNNCNEDPYWKVRETLEINEKLKNTSINRTMGANTDQENISFWTDVISHYLLSVQIFQGSPISLNHKKFISRIKPSIQRGRLLIALAGGWSSNVVVFYNNKNWYDVGHVSIFTKDKNNVILEKNSEDNFNLDYQCTIAANVRTNIGKGVQKEWIKEVWEEKHGLAFVGQVFDVKWRWYYRKWYDFGFRKEKKDVNNYSIYSKAISKKEKPYCNVAQVFFSKWAAPDKFICSSLAWWTAKKGCGVNIGDWWKPTIFPAGVFASDRVRIIDNTLY